MKKTFRFLALSFALICGTVSAWADARPADGPIDGASVGATVATTEGLQGVVTYVVNGWDGTLNAYTVQIEGLDYDGLHSEDPITTLTIQTSFVEKWKTVQYKYYVNKIIDTQGDDPTEALGIAYKKAFYAMTELESLTFQATESAVPTSAFTFEVGQYAFYGCDHLTSLVFPDNVSRIGKYAFQGTKITEFTIPAKCGEIGACAFNDTKKLQTVKVSDAGNDALLTIDKQAFANSSVNKLDLSNATALTSINDQAFIFNVSDVNAQLATVILPDVDHATNPFVSLGATGTCFANCMALATITNLDKSNVTDINSGAFMNCEELTQLDLPATATIYTDGITSPFLNTPKLKKITFADGWGKNGEKIEDGVYTSTDGKKIKYDTNTKQYQLLDWSLSAADKKKELSYLEEIEFKGKVYGTIDFDAFGSNTATSACSGLKKVTFGGIIGQGTIIGARAFANCSALATLTFNGFEIENNLTADIVIDKDAFKATAITAVDFKGFTLAGNATPSTILISNGAFAADNLAQVTFGNITFNEYNDGTNWNGDNANVFQINDGAFVSDKLTKVEFGDIVNDNTHEVSTGVGTLTIGDGLAPVFAPKAMFPTNSSGVLQEVKFGKMVTGIFTINPYAFSSEVLKTVTIGDVTTVLDKDGSLAIGKQAFGYETVDANNRKANAKTVTIGNLVETFTAPTKANTLTVSVGDAAFYGDKLATVTIGEIGAEATTIGATGSSANAPFGGNFAEKSVTIGDITSGNWTIKDNSFEGQLLKSVKIGDIVNDAPTTATISAYAFANRSIDDETFEAMDETVTIGKLANAKLSISQNAFRGPQKSESSFTVTIKGEAGEDGNEPGIVKNPTLIAAGAFQGPSFGTTSYTLGDIDVATTGIAGKAFGGSRDNATDKNNNTDVTIGNYNQKFQNVNTFTYVDDIVAKSWNCNQVITTFQNPKTLTIENDVTATLNGGGLNSNKLESLTIGGNVASTATIKNFGEAVRHIAFTAEDPEVWAGAIASEAFYLASDDAADAETISVIYRVKTAKKSNAIFDKNAFGYDDVYKNVVLYTDQWSMEHTFQNVEIGGDADHVYRIKLSASSVAPGEDIAATCIVGANAKYAYGRLYIPAGTGMRYKISSEYDSETGKNGVNLFAATISGTDIYMNTVTVMNGYYWIDANETAQTLIVRKTQAGTAGDKVTVEAEFVSQEEAEAMDAEGTVILDTDWFDAASAKKNALQYATSDITPVEFQNDAKTHNKGIYVMANPKKNNLAFAKYDQTKADAKDMAKGSVYVVTRADQYARLNVIWPEDIDEESATAIQKIENNVEANDVIYNLQGVRLNKAQKGINIINGKKVIKK